MRINFAENTQVTVGILESHNIAVNCLIFIPPQKINPKRQLATVFTHGYTSSKASIITWASRFADEGHPCCIFDLPGHYLGGGTQRQLQSFEQFITETPMLFEQAFEKIADVMQQHSKNIDSWIMGGHSLGGLMAIRASQHKFFKTKQQRSVCAVGLGLNLQVKNHLFDSELYAKTMNIRRQLVSEVMDSVVVFPWIKNQKHTLEVSGETVTLITGEDDVVVGQGGAAYLRDKLEETGNRVTLLEPKSLAHHRPELAATHIYNNYKKTYNL